MTNAKKLVAGDEIDSNCLKCKDTTNHTIIAMQKDKVAKVQCNSCDGRHNYRPAKAEASTKINRPANKKTRTKSPSSTSKEMKDAANFERLLTGRNKSEALPYSMTATFSKDDLVDHPHYGLGIVTSIIRPNKIELTFKEGSRIFICVLRRSSPLQRK